ncbi:MAG TPA: dihydrolipoyl dehydrogenase, partial [Gemmatimonadaceae bacterium]|nr:dihydrolipoyl dehydrogenase [Gemmatimonadaceae bacterium]
KKSGREHRVGKFPFSANGRARTAGESTGFIKIIADARSDELLGAHLIGPTVSELVSELVLAFEFQGSAEDVAITVHAHPTLAEVTKEAALGALGRAIHI